MTVTVNAEPIDLTLEGEKTALELVNGLNDRLLESNMLITDFDIDGRNSDGLSDADLTATPAAEVTRLDVRAAPFEDIRSVLAGEAAESAHALEAVLPVLRDTAVNLQTGKDREALEAIRIFSERTSVSARIFSIAGRMRRGAGLPDIGGGTAADFFASLNGSLRELETAFQNKDTVLLGDIAEYEIAPRLLDLIASLRSL